MIESLDNETLAFLVYCTEDGIYEIEPYNSSFQDKAKLITRKLAEEYTRRGLDYKQFEDDYHGEGVA